jgi:hypothetical protein
VAIANNDLDLFVMVFYLARKIIQNDLKKSQKALVRCLGN